MKKNIPILWYDGDGDLPLSKYTYSNQLYDSCNLKDYENITVIGPYEYNIIDKVKKFVFVPYNLDYDNIPDIIPDKTNYEYITTYVGNNFKRKHYSEYFEKLCKYGKVRVIGAGWSEQRKSNTKVNYEPSQILTRDQFSKIFKESLIGLYGVPKSCIKIGHYTLRISEYLISGMYIVPEKLQHMVDKFPPNQIFLEDLMNEDKSDFLKDLSINYEKYVKEQREFLKKTFDSNNYVKVYAEALGLE